MSPQPLWRFETFYLFANEVLMGAVLISVAVGVCHLHLLSHNVAVTQLFDTVTMMNGYTNKV